MRLIIDRSADIAANPFHGDLLVGTIGHHLVESLLHGSLQLRIVLADGDADGDAATFDVRRFETANPFRRFP